MTERKQYVVAVRFGRYNNPRSDLAPLADALSLRFEGEICAYAKQRDVFSHGSIQVRCFKSAAPAGAWRRIPFALWTIYRAWRARWLLGRDVVILAYDPFQSGLIGVLAKLVTGGLLVCEVNGDYGDPAALERSPQAARRLLALGARVLRRSDGVKLLFERQLDGFHGVDSYPPRLILPNPVDTATFLAASETQEDILLFVGYPFYLKGVDVLLAAFGQIAHKHPSWKLVLIGFRIEEEARSSGVTIPPNTSFLPPQPPENIASWMSRSRALVLPSRTEAMGRVLLEAACAGRARIASDVGGVSNVIDHGVDGLLFTSQSSKALAGVLDTFMSDRALQMALSLHAHKRALENFSHEAYASSYSSFVTTLRAQPSLRTFRSNE